MTAHLFLVDVEATTPTPYSGVMTEFGVVSFDTRAWFHGHLWDFHPDADIPALPVAERENPGHTTSLSGRRMNLHQAADVFQRLAAWMNGFDGNPQFVSDNPAFDFMWMADGFDRAGMRNPFGFSARRIGDLAAGLSGNWRRTSDWKSLRKTTHDHNPVNDSLGNAEALHALLVKYGQIPAAQE